MLRILQKQLTTPVKTWRNSSVIFWFALSLTYAIIYAYVGGLSLAFEDNYIIQDDGRQHIYWMMRYIDPELFPNDLITNYFQSLAPFGYANLYKLAVVFGIDPISFSKILPLLLGLIATIFGFAFTLEIFPIPIAGFLAASLLNQTMWMSDNVVSATGRAFVTPLFLFFLYALVRRSVILCLGAIALISVFYPNYALMAAGVIFLQLINWEKGKLKLTNNRKDYLICGTGLGIIFILLLPFALNLSDFSPVVSLEQAKQLPEFYPGGRSTFFWNNPWIYWFFGRSGMFPINIFLTPLLFFGILLPIFVKFPNKFPLVQKLQPQSAVLAKTLIVGFSWFFAAHAVLFRLYLPNRYTQYSLPIILPIAGAIVLTILLNNLCSWAQKSSFSWFPQLIPLTATVGLSLLVLLYPGIVQAFPQSFYIKGNHPELYDFLAQQPKDIMIASITEEADNIPTFAKRSVLISREAAIPYNLGYYQPFRKRVIDTITAHYSTDIKVLKAFNDEHDIDYWLVKSETFDPSYLTPETADSPFEYFNSTHKSWLQQYQPVVTKARERLETNQIPALAKVAEECTVLNDGEYFLINADCINNSQL